MKFKIKDDLEIEIDGIAAIVPQLNAGIDGTGKPLTYGAKIRYIDGSVVHIKDMTTEEVHARITAFRETFR